MKKVYLYRVDAVVPPGTEWGWNPPDWDEWVEENGYTSRSQVDGSIEYMEFRWPRNRHFLTREAAERTATRFRKWGAIAEVVRSKPIEFP